MLSPSSGRRYRSKVPQSTVYHHSVRVYNDGAQRILSPTLKPKHARQATNGPKGSAGRVYPYDPPALRGGFGCCNGECFKQYQDPDDARIRIAREPFFDKTIGLSDKAALRLALHGRWKNTLLLNDGAPVCTTMACRIFGCSRTKLFPDKRIKERNPTVPELTKPCPKAESV